MVRRVAREGSLVDRPLDAVLSAAASVQTVRVMGRNLETHCPRRDVGAGRRSERRCRRGLSVDDHVRNDFAAPAEAVDDVDQFAGQAVRSQVDVYAIARRELEAVRVDRLAQVEPVDGNDARVESTEVGCDDPPIRGIEQSQPHAFTGPK